MHGDNQNKIEKLKKLKSEIEKKYGKRKVWFFDEGKDTSEGVKGFLGTQRIFFLGLNPSSGTNPSAKEKLYHRLKKSGFTEAHITDLIKIIAKNNDSKKLIKNKSVLKKQISYLKREISAIEPVIIVAMGDKCYEILTTEFDVYLKVRDSYIPIKPITHYSYRFKKKKNLKKEFSEEIKDVKKLFRKRIKRNSSCE